MKSTELRIGNLVLDKKDREITIITVAHINEGLINYWMENVYLPIPLNEEWLIKFGFKEKHVFEMVSEWSIGEHRVQSDAEIFIWMGYKGGVQLRFVHQLQNLYFALTSKELTTNTHLRG